MLYNYCYGKNGQGLQLHAVATDYSVVNREKIKKEHAMVKHRDGGREGGGERFSGMEWRNHIFGGKLFSR